MQYIIKLKDGQTLTKSVCIGRNTIDKLRRTAKTTNNYNNNNYNNNNHGGGGSLDV